MVGVCNRCKKEKNIREDALCSRCRSIYKQRELVKSPLREWNGKNNSPTSGTFDRWIK
jgi:hypothetical protein